MGRCDYFGCDGDGNLSYSCNYCTQEFCTEHQFPEKHNCPGLPNSITLGPDFRGVGTDDEGEIQLPACKDCDSPRLFGEEYCEDCLEERADAERGVCQSENCDRTVREDGEERCETCRRVDGQDESDDSDDGDRDEAESNAQAVSASEGEGGAAAATADRDRSSATTRTRVCANDACRNHAPVGDDLCVPCRRRRERMSSRSPDIDRHGNLSTGQSAAAATQHDGGSTSRVRRLVRAIANLLS